MSGNKPHLSFRQIINMNFGFFGLQLAFGLEQANMSMIYSYLGVEGKELPYLWLAGPVTGLIVQPIIGAMSDRTVTRWGRRTPYFLIGAIISSIGLLFMPFSPSLWVAASLLWILDAANNVTMEPYRAFVSDKLNKDQHSLGFLTQGAFTGLGQTLAYLMPSLLIWMGMERDWVSDNNIPYTTYAAFLIGSVLVLSSIVWSIYTTKEIPLTPSEIEEIRSRPTGAGATLREIGQAIRHMPLTMRMLAPVMLFQWYAMFCYWMYITQAVALSLFDTVDPNTPAFREAGLVTGRMGAFYNFIAFVGGFALVGVTRQLGPKITHALCLTAAGIGMLCLPMLRDQTLMFLPMVGIGLAWASMLGTPYVILAGSLPKHRVGVYMGIFNMFIVIPMIIQIFTLPLMYDTWLQSNPAHVIRLAGGLLVCAAVAVLFVKTAKTEDQTTQEQSANLAAGKA